MIGEIIGEVVGQIFIDIIFNKILSPILKSIGASVRWIYFFGKVSFLEIYRKDYNTRFGFVITILIIVTLIILFR